MTSGSSHWFMYPFDFWFHHFWSISLFSDTINCSWLISFFSSPAEESEISPRCPGFFQWRMLFVRQDFSERYVYCSLSISASKPSQERARIYMNYIICNYFIYPYIYIHKYLFIFCQLKTMNWRLYFNFQSNISGFILVFPFSLFVISTSSSNQSNPIVLKIYNYFIMSLHMYPILIKAIIPLLSALPIPQNLKTNSSFCLVPQYVIASTFVILPHRRHLHPTQSQLLHTRPPPPTSPASHLPQLGHSFLISNQLP